MTSDFTDINNTPMPEETPATQTSLDLLNSFLNAPTTKLDADEYMVHDLHGVTEGLNGSGNLNFLMLQAGQTNEAIVNADPFDLSDNGQNSTESSNLFSPNGTLPASGSAAAGDTSFDRAFAQPDDVRSHGEFGAAGGHNIGAAGGLAVSDLAVNTQSMSPLSDTSFFSGTGAASESSSFIQTATNGVNGTSGIDGASGTNGTDGAPGLPGTPGEGGGDIVNIIDNTTTNLGDTITNLGDTVENIYHDTTNLLTEITNNAGDIITTTVNDITDIVNNTIDNLLGHDLGPIGINLDATLDDLTHLNLDILNGDNILNVINQTIDLSPILDPVTNLVGDVFSDVSLSAVLDPFQYDNSPTDTDLHIGTGLDLLGLGLPDLALDVPLDPVEALLGDIDVSLDLQQSLTDLLPGLAGGGNGDTDLGLGLGGAADLSPVADALQALTNPVEDIVGDLDIAGNLGLGLLGLDGDGAGAPDTDISVPLDLQLIDSPLLNDGLNISLDPLESVTGDIDLNLASSINLLGDVAAPVIDAIAGGSGSNAPLGMLGDVLGDVAGGILPMDNSGDTDLSLHTGLDILDTTLLNNGLDVVLNPVEDLAGDIDIGGNIGLGLLGMDGDGTGAPDTDISIPLDIQFLDNPLLNDGLNISLDPIESITGDIDLDLTSSANLFGDIASPVIDAIAGGSGTDSPLSMIGDVLGDAAGGLLPMDNNSGDTDLSLNTGIDILDTTVLNNGLDVVLDPVESLTGDIDIGGNIGLGLLGSSTDDVAGGNDLNIGLDGLGLGDIGLNLDPVESIVGDIDLGANISTDLTGNLSDPSSLADTLLGGIMDTLNNTVDTAAGLLDSTPLSSGGLDLGILTGGNSGDGGLDISSWTENILPDPGNVLGGGLADSGSIIPDIISEPAASLPVPVVPVVTGILGGVLGGGDSHHHGGLFG